MAVINLTPDSFSDGGRLKTTKEALDAALEAAGWAEVIDLGPQSTRPGYTEVGSAVELERLMPVLEALRPRTDRLISVDTYHIETARAALSAGADIINTVRPSDRLAALCAQRGAGLVITHSEALSPTEGDVAGLVAGRLARLAAASGARPLWIDPGLGFGKSLAQNWALIAGLSRLVETGYPVLVAASRKSFLPHPKQEWTRRVTAIAEAAGCDMARVHRP